MSSSTLSRLISRVYPARFCSICFDSVENEIIELDTVNDLINIDISYLDEKINVIFCKSMSAENSVHYVCGECINNYIDTCMASGRNFFQCVCGKNCSGIYKLAEMLRIAREEKHFLIKKMYNISYANYVSSIIDDCQICPHCREYACVVDSTKSANCEMCFRKWCTVCRNDYHYDRNCFEFCKDCSDDFIELSVQEAITSAISKKCPQCSVRYEKIEGCNLILCEKCDTYLCHVCGIVIIPRGQKKEILHWHFIGSGSQASDAKCPLYSDGNDDNKKKLIRSICKMIIDANHNPRIIAAIEKSLRTLKINYKKTFFEKLEDFLFGIFKKNK